jgi:hypothetical protein
MKIREFRAAAREALCGNWFVAVVAYVIVTIFSGGGLTLEMNSEELSAIAGGANVPTELLLVLLGMTLLIAVLSLVFSSLVTVGYAQFNIDLIDGEKPRIGTLFTKWRQIGKAIVASLLVFFRVLVVSKGFDEGIIVFRLF